MNGFSFAAAGVVVVAVARLIWSGGSVTAVALEGTAPLEARPCFEPKARPVGHFTHFTTAPSTLGNASRICGVDEANVVWCWNLDGVTIASIGDGGVTKKAIVAERLCLPADLNARPVVSPGTDGGVSGPWDGG